MLCPKCQKEIDNQDSYCKSCGAEVRTDKPTPWYFRGWFVILMAFVVLGPLAIPLLWKSPEFSKRAKIILTVVIIIYTLILLVIPYLILMRIYSNISSLMPY